MLFISLESCTTEVYYKSDGSCACGFFLESGLTWFESVDQCTALGARLPEIHTPKENADIFKLKVTLKHLLRKYLRHIFPYK